MCNDLILDASQSRGSGGIPLQFAWSLSSEIPNDPNEDIMNALVSSQTAQILQIASADLQSKFYPGRTVIITLTVTNAFGAQDSTDFPVFIQQASVPTVSISPAELMVDSHTDIKFHGSVLVPAEDCSGFSPEDLVFSWARTAGPTFILDADSSNSRDLLIPAGSLQAGNYYQVELRVAYKNSPKIFGRSTATLYVQQSELVASIPQLCSPC